MEFKKGMKIVVIGGGESGVGAALLAQRLGMDVYVSEKGKIKDSYKEELIKNNIRFEEGGHKVEWLLNVHVAIKSPGVPDYSPVIRSLRENRIPFFSEIEFGYHFYTGRLLAVTGSNGKTTTSGLLGHVLLTAGFDVKLGGNVGVSFCRILADRSPDVMVLEVSSFQLDNVKSFKPDVAILLNISPDHLDRYEHQMDLYAAAKMKIAQQQTQGDCFIYNGDNEEIISRLHTVQTNASQIAITEKMYTNGIMNKSGRPMQLSLTGRHNAFNAACVVEAARFIGLDDESIEEGLKTYKNFPHRLEVVGDIDGITFINDSKATNTDAVFQALSAMDRPVIWIAGGVDKGNDYTSISALVIEKVKGLVCLGKDNSKLKQLATGIQQYKADFKVYETTSVSQAIQQSLTMAKRGDVVLLSPACASFDLFNNYEDRGGQFRQAVLSEIKTTN